MPRLYCEEHGREDAARSEADQDNYRRLGEAILVVTGPLQRAGVRCDRCNARLTRGSRAYVVTALPRPSPDHLSAYDYAYEGHYLTLARAEVKVYGLQPRGGMPSPASVLGTR